MLHSIKDWGLFLKDRNNDGNLSCCWSKVFYFVKLKPEVTMFCSCRLSGLVRRSCLCSWNKRSRSSSTSGECVFRKASFFLILDGIHFYFIFYRVYSQTVESDEFNRGRIFTQKNPNFILRADFDSTEIL